MLRDELTHPPGQIAHRDNLEVVRQCHQGSNEGVALVRIPTAKQGSTAPASRALAQTGVKEIRRRQAVAPDGAR